jgi:hypothetical protein
LHESGTTSHLLRHIEAFHPNVFFTNEKVKA